MVSGQPLYGYLQRLEHMMSQGELIPSSYITGHRHRWYSRRSGSHNNASSSGHSGSRRPRLISPDYPDFIVPGTSGFRRHIYNSNLWVRRIPDLTGRFRECSAEFFLNNPAQIHRLVPWLNRELNVLLHGTDHQTPEVVAVIMDLLPRYNIRSQEFRNALLPFVGERTDHFIHEFYAFGTSPYDMVGYDRICLYGPRFQFSDNDLSDSSSDSDIQVVDVVHSDSAVNAAVANVPSYNATLPQSGSPIAGPSHTSDNQDTLIAVSSGEDSDSSDCQFVGSVKPRHLRTPEVITLGDSDSHGVPENNESHNVNDISDLSDGEVDCKPIISNRNMMSRCQYNDNLPRRSLSVVYTSEESSGEEWILQQKRSVNKKLKKEKRERSSSKKKIKEKETGKKKKISKEKKKPVKHWKKKLCRKIESSSSSDERPIMVCKRKPRVLSSSSDLQTDDEHKIDHDYINPYYQRCKKKEHSSRLKSVVHVRRNARESNDTPLRDSDRGPSICSGTSSHCSTNCSGPSTSSHCSANYTACMIPNGDYNPRILLRRNRLRLSSVSSSSSSLSSSSTSSSTLYSSSRKRRHRKIKSKKKRT